MDVVARKHRLVAPDAAERGDVCSVVHLDGAELLARVSSQVEDALVAGVVVGLMHALVQTVGVMHC